MTYEEMIKQLEKSGLSFLWAAWFMLRSVRKGSVDLPGGLTLIHDDRAGVYDLVETI